MKTHVSIILDKSGSMQSVQDATISGLNEYLQTLRNDGNEYTVDVTLFDTEVKSPYVNADIKAIEPFTRATYNPDGGTALYDAVCKTLVARKGEGGKWLVVIMTDGGENGSKEFDEKQLKGMVTLLQNTGNVTFVFLGANQDAWANASKWGMHINNVANYNSTVQGTARAMNMMASNTSNFATGSLSTTDAFFSQADQDNLKNTK